MLFPGYAARTVLFKPIEPTPKFSALRRGHGHIGRIEAIPELTDERKALLRRQAREFIVADSWHECQPNPKWPGTSSLEAEVRGAASVAASFHR